MESAVLLSGGAMVLVIGTMLFFLGHESKYAFQRKFDYGYRFALQPETPPEEHDISLDPNASLLTANREGEDGLDEKEEGITLPTLEQLSGAPGFGTGSPLNASLANASPENVYRDDWRSQKSPEQGQKFLLYGFANSEYKGKTMALAWQPDAAFDPKAAVFDLRLRLVSAPAGVKLDPIDIDLRKQPSGRILIPTYVAKTDADRLNGYVFEMEARPITSSFAATLRGFFSSKWDPTLSYASFGAVPLIFGTLFVTALALLIAAPLGVTTAIYLAEVASPRLREWLKPLLELLASVPTIVLAYLGLMILAPGIQKTVAQALGLESGRSVLTTSIIMAVLLIPTIASVAEDALRSIPGSLRAGGEALGLTPMEGLRKIVLPAARPGFIAAVMLGMARSIGETMIVWILGGGTPFLPSFQGLKDTAANLARPVRGIPDSIAIEMGNVDFEGVHYGHLFLLGLVLFIITLSINLFAQRLTRRFAWRA